MQIKKLSNLSKYLIFLPLLIYFGKRSLIAFDEGFYAIQAHWIIDKSNWVGPMWWDQVSSDRTIGIQFLLAMSEKFFGDSLFALYLPITIASALMLFCTYHLHKEIVNDRDPIYSPLILSTTFLWITYAHMATQDIVFSSIVSLGIITSIKASRTNKSFYILLSGIWIGLAVMLKTYLTVIPLLSIIPFLIRSKLYFKKFFWIGLILGFLPFILWSYKYISIYSFETYSGLFEKLNRLSKNNTFTKPFYYYLYNLPLNIFPWTLFAILGFIRSYKMNNLSKYFLFIYPFFTLTLLSFFSTKTPYYPLLTLPLLSINSYIGIKSIIELRHIKIISKLEKFNYIFLPFIIICFLFFINFTSIIELDSKVKLFLSIGGGLFSLSWITYIKNKNNKKLFSILGPYLLILCLVQSGLITDKSKALRIESEELIKKENLSKYYVEVLKPEINNDDSYSKIIKIMIQMPLIGKGIDNLDQLQDNNYAWTTKSNENINKENFSIVNDKEVFYPWKLIYKR